MDLIGKTVKIKEKQEIGYAIRMYYTGQIDSIYNKQTYDNWKGIIDDFGGFISSYINEKNYLTFKVIDVLPDPNNYYVCQITDKKELYFLYVKSQLIYKIEKGYFEIQKPIVNLPNHLFEV